MNFEVLAPAGSMESLIAGVRSGANAIYLGGKSFNARRNAGNFDNEELKRAVEYCHSHGVKVYLTLNILVRDDEMENAYNTVRDALLCGVDAFIVQDIGVAKMIREHFQSARLHGSTQMSIMTPNGAKAAKEMGFSRIVLPREMNLEEIKEIRESTDLELELFVHGALCMSVSGQCYLSSVIGSRSGNRGLCAQPCRLPFTAGGNANHALSLKDLSLIGELDKLDGITSLKIEGRMKRPEYVSAAVSAVKKAIDGEYSSSDEFMLRSVFSRSGFTNGYLKCHDNEKAVLIAKSDKKEVTVIGDVPEKAINKPMSEESLKERLSKFGGTQYFSKNIEINLDDGLILPASKINEMRRNAVSKLDEQEKIELQYKPFNVFLPKYNQRDKPYATASFSNASQIPDNHPFERVFIPVNSSLEDFVDNRAGVVLPRGLFGIERELKIRLEKLKKAGVNKALCGNIGSYTLCKDMGFEVYGDFGLNVFNSLSANQIDHPILSFELTQSQINNINARDKGMIVYGYLPLMLNRNCPVKNDIGCFECDKHGRLTDRKGMEFPVMCSDFPCVEMLNCHPLYMLDRLETDFIHFYFSIESKKQVEKVIALYENREKPDFKYTRGLYQRGTL